MTHLRAVLLIATVAAVVATPRAAADPPSDAAVPAAVGTSGPGRSLLGAPHPEWAVQAWSGAPAYISGNASYAVPSLGPNYLAMELPHGTLVTITGPGGSWTARVNDYGPSRYIQPRRVADVALIHWLKICGVTTTRIGLCFVSVSRAGLPVAPRPTAPLPTGPPTDAEAGS